jgi:hypothetical protein
MPGLEEDMKKLILTAALVLSSTGCCATRDADTQVSVESYKAAITKIRSNVAEIRSDVVLIDYDKDLKEANVQLIDATLTLCDDTLAGKNACVATTESGQ